MKATTANSIPRGSFRKKEPVSLKATAIVKQLGWCGFIKLLAHLPGFVALFSRLVKDPRVSLRAKLFLAGVFAYIIIPTDLLPDWMIGLGQMDDLAVLLAGLKFFLKLCPSEVVEEHLRAVSAGQTGDMRGA
jgi:uncharacterized membrane protein YkvA (DUF1232 family)